MNNQEYHNRSEISKSDIDLLLKSPYHFKNKHLFREENRNFDVGSSVHSLVLEPHLFDQEFAVAPNCDRRTKAGKEAYNNFVSESEGKTVLTREDYMLCNSMAESVHNQQGTKVFLRDGIAEYSHFSELEGVPVRCRPDYYNEKLGVIVDLKTTNDASHKGFMSSVGKFNYHIQVAFYTDVMKSLGYSVNKFLFIVVEKKAPHMVGFYELDHVAIEEGEKKYKEALELYKECKKNKNWWGYADYNKDTKQVNIIQIISLPTWKFYE
jgi:exodeoxyribonuclease VIII